VLRNLLANAIDHSEGNPVTIDIGHTETAIAVAVTDQGVGLKEGQEELVFNRFWRADASRKRHSGGTGLGLAIASAAATLYGGGVDATASPGVGSRFRPIIPREPAAAFGEEPLPLVLPNAPVANDEESED